MVVDGLVENQWAQDINGFIGIHKIGQYLCLHEIGEHANGQYTSKSAYLDSFHGSTNYAPWKLI
jgi:hypothetical protein